jgi:hypothetical protein
VLQATFNDLIFCLKFTQEKLDAWDGEVAENKSWEINNFGTRTLPQRQKKLTRLTGDEILLFISLISPSTRSL